MSRIVVLVHGWSVHNTDTYGGLADRLESENQKNPQLNIDVKQIWLSKYVSFKDEVRLDDISLAFEHAIQKEFGSQLKNSTKLICITHSTGGPVIRNWQDKFYYQKNKLNDCPLSHLIMLAPANFGSALAQLGKSRVSRLKSWFEGIEPGQGVLNWLELGSNDAWQLNKRWICESADAWMKNNGFYPFVISGQSIDRNFYDHVNSYTGELGSDGVVRLAAANLNAGYIKLEQSSASSDLEVKEVKGTPRIAFAVAKGKAHSGDKMGVMRSIRDDNNTNTTLELILKCIQVNNRQDYINVCHDFDLINQRVLAEELIETDKNLLLPDKYFIHDNRSMLIVKVTDNEGKDIGEFDVIFTGPNNNPNVLPDGFLADRQRNSNSKNTVTFFFNYTIMMGTEEIKWKGKTIREKRDGVQQLGMIIEPHSNSGFAHYVKAIINASAEQLNMVLKAHQTTMIEIVMKRIIHEGVYGITKDRNPEEFKGTGSGSTINSI